jgi:hypothetical protein
MFIDYSNNSHRHIVLYCKNHYMHDHRQDFTMDLKVIFSKIYLLHPKEYTNMDVLCRMLDVWEEINANESECQKQTSRFIAKSFHRMHMETMFNGKYEKDYTIDNLIYNMILEIKSRIQFTTCFDKDGTELLRLGEADPKIWPLSNEYKKRLKEKEDSI